MYFSEIARSLWFFMMVGATGSNALADQFCKVLCGQSSGGIGAGQDAVNEVAFFAVHQQNLFFDGAACNDAVDHDGFCLTDAVGTVGRLIFDSGIPPWIHVNDVVGRGEIQTGAAGFERNQEGITFAALEGFDAFLSLRGRGLSVKVLEGDAGFFAGLANQIEVRGELAEDEWAAATFLQLLELFEEEVQFGRRVFPGLVDKSDVAGQLSQTSKNLQNLETLIVGEFFAADLIEFCDGCQSHFIIAAAFCGRQIDEQIGFCACGQIAEYFGLGAAQNERCDDAGEGRLTIGVSIFFDG